MRIAAFGDGALSSFIGTCGFGWHQPDVAHELAGMIEAQDVDELADGDHCGNEFEALKRQKDFHGGAQIPGFKQISAIRGVRHIDRIEVPGTQETSEVCGIVFIGLDAITRLLGDQRGGHDQACHTELLEASGKDNRRGRR